MGVEPLGLGSRIMAIITSRTLADTKHNFDIWIEEERLTDGSTVCNVILADTDNKTQMVFHTYTPLDAVQLAGNLSEAINVRTADVARCSH